MDACKLVWGVVLLLAGLALAAWSAWHGVADARHWWHAHQALQQLAAGSGGAGAHPSGAADDLLGLLRSGVAAIPGAGPWLRAGLQQRERLALHSLLWQLALLLLAALLLWLGNRWLGQASPTRRSG